MHQPALQANGFEVKELASGQLTLTSVPFSRFIVFGVSDIVELLTLLEQQGSSMRQEDIASSASKPAAQRWGTDVVRPSRYISIHLHVKVVLSFIFPYSVTSDLCADGHSPLGSLKELIQHGATSVNRADALLCAYDCTEHNWPITRGSSEEELSNTLEPALFLFFDRQKKQH